MILTRQCAVSYQWSAGDTDTAGVFLGEFEVVKSLVELMGSCLSVHEDQCAGQWIVSLPGRLSPARVEKLPGCPGRISIQMPG